MSILMCGPSHVLSGRHSCETLVYTSCTHAAGKIDWGLDTNMPDGFSAILETRACLGCRISRKADCAKYFIYGICSFNFELKHLGQNLKMLKTFYKETPPWFLPPTYHSPIPTSRAAHTTRVCLTQSWPSGHVVSWLNAAIEQFFIHIAPVKGRWAGIGIAGIISDKPHLDAQGFQKPSVA